MGKTIIIMTLLFSFWGCSKDSKTAPDKPQAQSGEKVRAQDLEVDSNSLSKAVATIKTVHGNVSFKFYPKHAPNTVTRVIELMQKGFYDGISFHRVVANFVVQGGDPTGTGMSGSGKNLKAEFNAIQHIKGTVAMARSQDVDSADSQFYLALTTLPHLDGKYTVFGQVIDGFEILEKITQGDKMLSVSVDL
jgi:cyclophilin family peptidyl-prolyl cis-trans isomerase